MDFAKLLPMAFVMIAGPQILSAIFFATSENWKGTSLAYVFGASLSITAFVTAAYLIGDGASSGGTSNDTIYIVVLVLLVLAAIQTYRGREESEPPKWMGKLQGATPKFAFILGLLLLGIFPTDILTSFAMGSYLAAHGDPWWHALPFIGLTLFLLAIPFLAVVVLGDRAKRSLPKIRDWMNDNSWVVSEVVIVFFIFLTASNLS